MNESQKLLDEVLSIALAEQSSDLHLVPNNPPILRVNRRLVVLIKKKKLDFNDTQALAFLLMTEEQKENFVKNKEIDFSYTYEKKARFRVNIFFQNEGISIALRLINREIKTISELNLPEVLHEFLKATEGLFLVVGPSSHGKSTTLAAMIDEVNHQQQSHILTIEDPIEYIFENNQSIIEQREVGKDTATFAKAIRASLRQDPDVLMIGEMRDQESMSTALTAAETGHLVLSTLHTMSASQTINRIIDVFSSEQQNQIRFQLSSTLLGIVSQRLIPSTEGGLIPACEILVSNPAIRNLIRENKIHEIPLIISTSRDEGMVSLDYALGDLIRKDKISMENALRYSLNPNELRKLI
ncbi:MAG: PilT/PilU family type 4a pilus ATPase [bacterium]|nr:PilT/PilU family type 4a pilus ATPase [bacterium]